MKRLNALLNNLIGAFIGMFVGHGIYVIWKFKTHPEAYAMQSAPWYTNILLYGVVTLIIIFIAIIVKAFIKKHK